MTLVADLVTRLRTEFLDDAVAAAEEDYRWQTSDIVAALSWAHDTLARRLFLIEDASTTAVCEIAVVADGNGDFPRVVALHEKVVRVDRLKFPGVTRPLTPTNRGALDQFDGGWDERVGTPTHYVVDKTSKKITFNRQPLSGGTVTLVVRRKPLLPFTLDTIDTAEPEADYDDALCHGALTRLYSKDDKQTLDLNRVNRWQGEFDNDIRTIMREVAAVSPDIFVMRPE